MFGLHSALDWTWFVPGNAVPALLCAGWVAARGPLRDHPVPPSPLRRRPPPARAAAAAVLTAGAVAAAWAVVQPLRAQQAQDAAYAELARGNTVHAAALARAA